MINKLLFLLILLACESHSDGITQDYSLVYPASASYPAEAQEKSIEGWVVLIFDVNVEGRADNITVLRSYPGKIFDESGVNAVQRRKYKPKKINGVAYRVKGVQVWYQYCLDSIETSNRFCIDREYFDSLIDPIIYPDE